MFAAAAVAEEVYSSTLRDELAARRRSVMAVALPPWRGSHKSAAAMDEAFDRVAQAPPIS